MMTYGISQNLVSEGMCARARVCVCSSAVAAHSNAVLEPSHKVKVLLKGGRTRFAEGVQGVESLVIQFKQPVVVHTIQLLNSLHSRE